MAKSFSKFLDTYNLLTLRDVETAFLGEENILVYNSAAQKFKNQAIQVFGKDSNSKRKQNLETNTGADFSLYDSLTFNVSGVSGVNEYRINADFVWQHDSVNNDIIMQLHLDGVLVGEEFSFKPEDSLSNQKQQNNILDYVANLSWGDHLLELFYKPATSSKTSIVLKSVLEVWRTK